MKKMAYFTMALALVIMVSCGGANTPKNDATSNNDEQKTTPQEQVDQTQPAGPDLSVGEAIYTGKGNCATCHQATGQGLAPTFPPLAGADYLLADKERAIHQTMFGSQEPITVNGVQYPGKVMTVVELTDQEVVDVVNYILNSWGNEGGTVTLDEVKAIRGAAE